MRIQDFRFFIPPNFPLKEKHPSRSLRITPGGNPFRYDEAKLRVLRILHQLLNFVSIADYYLSLVINTRFCFSVPFYFSGLYLCLCDAFPIKFLFSLLSGKMAASSFFSTSFGRNFLNLNPIYLTLDCGKFHKFFT